jgi:hypothetical protein
MPNWCVNQVDISGDEVDVARLVDFVKGDTSTNEDDVFSFAKIVPPPTSKFYAINEGQNDFQCGCKDKWVELTDLPKIEQVHKVDGEEVKEMVYQHERQVNGKTIVRGTPDKSTLRGFIDSEFGGTELCPEHFVPRNTNHPDWWYNWNVENWGSKWSASEAWNDRVDNADGMVAGQTSYNFDTAWAPVESLIAALAEQFPMLTITHRYCEGGMGFAGQVVYEGGQEASRMEYSAEDIGDDAWLKDENGKIEWGERDYDKVPMSEYESFCDEHFGGVVGG